MSKTALKKVIAKMDQSQLSSLILALYDAKIESKDYLDFFADPDIDKRLEKAKIAIDRAVHRTKRGQFKPKIAKMKLAVNSISALSPGEEYVSEIMLYAFKQLTVGAMFGRMSDTLIRSVMRFLRDIMNYADKHELSSTVFPAINEIIESLKTDYIYRREFKRLMTDTFNDCLKEISKKIF